MTLPTLVSLADLKRYIEINEDNSTFNDQLMQLSRIATKSLEVFCRRSFSNKQYSEIFNTRMTAQAEYDLGGGYGNGSGLIEKTGAQRFPLKGFPIAPETLVVNYDTSRKFEAATIVDSSGYYLNAAGNTLYLLNATTDAVMALKVVYTAGFATVTQGTDLVITGAPEDLQMACVTQCVYLFNKFRESNIGIKGSTKHSPEYVQNAQMLCPEAMSMAMEYRKNLMGRG